MNYAIILSGGTGSRFWPLSRKHLPKQFLKIIGRKSLLESTILRTRKIVPDKNIFILTNKNYLQQIKRDIVDFKIPEKNIILEPKPLNTLPAIALAAKILDTQDPEANLLVLPSDHYIKDGSLFKQVMLKALRISRSGYLCLIGIRPNRLHLGYGYMQSGKIIEDKVFHIRAFLEKPVISKALKIFNKKNIFWNSGIFCFKADTVLREIRRYAPKLHKKIEQIKSQDDIGRVWNRIQPISIDYGLLEKTKNLAMVVGEFFWSDIGSWDSLCDVLPKDMNNNVALAHCIHLDSTNTFVSSHNSKRLIATVGLKDVIIVDTPDALLICRRDKTQDIKRLVEVLKKKRKTCV